MEYKRLGKSGLHVSQICVGTMEFGDGANAQTAARIVSMARESGVNFIDTADVNSQGKSERIIGRLIRKDRDWWVVGTKVGNSMGSDVNSQGLNRKWLLQAVDDSLSRLATDYIDIYYPDIDDENTRIQEVICTLGDLIRCGKIRYWGISNFSAWRIAEIIRVCKECNIPQPIAGQPCYNAVTRTAEQEYLPVCAYFGIGVVPYSPLARGVLTGKYLPGSPPPKFSRAGRGDKRILETEYRRESILIAHQIGKRAREKGITAAQFAVNWVLNNSLVTSLVAGPRTIQQWTGYMDALQYNFTKEDEDFFNNLVPIGGTSTPGYNDPLYPILGRRPKTG